MIRELTPNDLEKASELGSKFWEEGHLPGEFKREVFVKNWETLFTIGMGTILGLFGDDGEPVGYLGLIFAPDLNSGDVTATEAFWYVDPTKRGNGLKLLKAMEELAIKKGCKRLTMVHLNNLHPEQLGNLYRRWGYTPVETHYIKTLS